MNMNKTYKSLLYHIKNLNAICNGTIAKRDDGKVCGLVGSNMLNSIESDISL